MGHLPYTINFDAQKYSTKRQFTNVISPLSTTNVTSKLSVEQIYQRKSPLDHILLRPDSYIGSVDKVRENVWIIDENKGEMVLKDLSYSPGLLKIFDEILVNAADNKQRDPSMSAIKIHIIPEQNMIRIWNDGKGIPVIHHKVEKMFVPSLIFGHLLTSSNYDDSQKKVTGGRNGYGAKLCNIFSKQFIVETSSKKYKSSFKQVWRDNMNSTAKPEISQASSTDFTSVTFYPDLARFKMEHLDEDIIQLFTRRAYDIAGLSPEIDVFLNDRLLPIKHFKDYVQLFTANKTDDQGQPLKVIYNKVNPRWEIAATLSSAGFQQVSFVNNIATTKGGSHVDLVVNQLLNKFADNIEKDGDPLTYKIKPFQIKSHLWVFVNCLIENPTFDSQTKETMTLQAKSFGSTCQLSQSFITEVFRSGIGQNIATWIKFKSAKLEKARWKALSLSDFSKIPKLDDANLAGTKSSHLCTLILTEGDSAKSLAVAGLGAIGRDHYGVFPLRGKMLNVRDLSRSQIFNNPELFNIIQILGLRYGETYDTVASLEELRYRKIMIMTDQDQDGSHIKGLIINFIHTHWPSLLQRDFIEVFITPILKVFKGSQRLSFYSLPEFEEWQKNTDDWTSWRVKYYKGLGTSSSLEAKQYFADMARHCIKFRYDGSQDDASIKLAFDKTKSDERKAWLTQWMHEKRQRVRLGVPEPYLYGKNTKSITFHDFVKQELVLFSNMDNERSIPSFVDGLKPGQRKILFTCFKRNLTKEIKVAQLAGSVSEMSSYHHGEVSLMGTIIGLAQDYVGSNNLNLLVPSGQFGTRLTGGKDAASPRYIFTCLQPLTRLIFHPHDDAILKYLYDDNQKIEPEWYIPIIPMVLVNGAEGIGTGWSTKVLNFSTEEIISNIERMLDDQEPLPMLPSYEGFTGTVQALKDNKYVFHGEISVIDKTTVEITDLPIRTWTQNYKETVLKPMVNSPNEYSIINYKELHTNSTVRFVIKMTLTKFREAEIVGFHKYFRLSTSVTLNSMVLFDQDNCIKRFHSVDQILTEFYNFRLPWYKKRKRFLEGVLSAESSKLENQARFVLEKIQGNVLVEDVTRDFLVERLKTFGYSFDPVHQWRIATDAKITLEDTENLTEEEVEETTSGPNFNYILNMPLWSLTKEKKDDLLKQRDIKQAELKLLRSKTDKMLWMEDLDRLKEGLEKMKANMTRTDLPTTTGSDRHPNLTTKSFKVCSGQRVLPPIKECYEEYLANEKKKSSQKTKNNVKISKSSEDSGYEDD